MGVQSGESPNFENFEIFDLGVLGKTPLGCSPYGESHKYYKGEGYGFP